MGLKSKNKVNPDRKYGPIFYNAVRLFEDAKILRKARRYPSSAALAILSLEELGKSLAYDTDFVDWISPRHRRGGNRQRHREKQRLAAEALIWIMGIDEIRALVSASGQYELIIAPSSTASNLPTMLEIISSIDETTYGKQRGAKIRNVKHHRSMVELAKGKFDRIKQECFYVDMVDGKFLVPEINIDRSTADRLISMASAAIFATKAMLHDFRNGRPHDQPAFGIWLS